MAIEDDPLADLFGELPSGVAVQDDPLADLFGPMPQTPPQQRDDPLADLFPPVQQPTQQTDPLADLFGPIEQPAEELEVVDEREPRIGSDMSSPRFWAGLAAQIGVSEGGRIAATAAGAKVGAAFGTAIPIPIVGTVSGAGIGALTGFILGGIAAGAAGSYTRQSIEDRDDFSYGELITDTLTNLISGNMMVRQGLRGAVPVGKSLARHTLERAQSAAFRQGIAGGIIGAGGEIIEGTVDDNREVTLRGIRDRALLGALLGGTLGATTEGAAGLYRKLARTSPAQLQEAILRQDPNLVRITDIITDMGNVPELNARQSAAMLFRVLRTEILPSSRLNKDALNSIRHIFSGEAMGKGVATDTSSAVRRQLLKVAPDQRARVEDDLVKYLLGGADSLPPEMTAIASELSEAAVLMQRGARQIIRAHDAGIITLPENFIASLTQQAETGRGWLTRQYRYFNDKHHAPTREQAKLARRELAQGYWEEGQKVKPGQTPMTRKEAYAKADARMARWAEARSMDPRTRGEFMKKGILEERQNLGTATRAYLGEITDAPTRIEASLARLSSLASWVDGDAATLAALREMGAVHSSIHGKSRELMEPLRLLSGTVEGAYVDPQVNRALTRIYGNGFAQEAGNLTEHVLSDIVNTGISVSKFVKVPLNPASYSTNLITNFFQLPQQAMFGIKHVGKAIRGAGSTFDTIRTRLESPQGRAYYRELVDMGLVEPNVLLADVLSGLKRGKLGKMAMESPPVTAAGKTYSFGDVGMRVYVYENYKDKLAREFPKLRSSVDTDTFNRLAATYTKDTYQQYSYIWQVGRMLSRVGVMNPFVAFTMELMRNQYNQGRLVLNMMNGKYAADILRLQGLRPTPGQSRTDFVRQAAQDGLVNQAAIRRDIGLRIAATSMMYGAAGYGVSKLHKDQGINEDKERALHTIFTPEFSKQQHMLFRLKGDDEVEYMDMSYILPQAQMGAPFFAAMRGESFGEALKNGMESYLSQMGGELNFFLQVIVPMFGNYDPSNGNPLSTREDVLPNALERIGWGLNTQYEPGFWRELRNTFGEEAQRTPEQFTRRMLGQRVNSLTYERAVEFRVNDIMRNLTKTRVDYSRLDRRNLLDRQGGDLQRNFEETFGRSHRLVDALRTMGRSNDEIAGLLAGAGFGGTNTIHALHGTFPPIRRDRENTVSGQWDRILELEPEKRMAAIRQTEDRGMRENLLRRYQALQRDERAGVGAIDRIVRGLGTQDGGRANVIFQIMQQSDNPEQVLQEFRRKDIATDIVMRQVRAMQRNP